ncbi:riboflavin biosynthesis protein RibF [Marinitoga sp. 1135]|uniref:Riboflavin biosynthesis protein n=1 Tax=Marinitoga piezophila (strain DSM 14283 / JCM 11233 / KA3) TaxID=443254 RepID=H2J4N2_MARPK|nr:MULTISPECIES: riboflavin biosynthesis protein RibF [Marinitoga]AEX85974.1 riboflavin kinase/FMN adenylyltransferase [Marinitoga piezophila KA3]APT76398.1 riboflavin biosynthesis protein RibF [Marinitoga sp. 1137]NUU96168.1 riboflavin biosynthesis protein RibF [Marinitoga sp. 1135]NUU98076.1 riboflavin biosynthesis protein RibF [Marinitoga sp. 1138]
MNYAVTIGTFDGVHKGHQVILKKTLDYAEKHQLKPKAYIMKYPALHHFSNDFVGLIYPSYKREEILQSMGFETEVFELPDVINITHGEYLDFLLNNGMKCIVCGEDFTFGKGKKGDINFLLAERHKKDFIVEIINDIKTSETRISSTFIRRSIQNGRIEEANKLLGRNWTLEGPVYEDRHVGFKLGFPTANIDIRYKEKIIYPKFGVYLVYGGVKNSPYKYFGLMSVGMRPTFNLDIKEPKVEIYFLDYFGDLYNKVIEVEVLKFMREEMKFSSEKELISQMIKDEDNARKLLSQFQN